MKKLQLRLLSVLCLAALLIACLPAAYAYGVCSAWAKPELDQMSELSLIPQVLEEKPNLWDSITRLEMCAIAVQAYEVYTGEEIPLPEEAPFSDTQDPIAGKAYAAGLTQGYEDGTFRPDRLLTRQEFFAFVDHFFRAFGRAPAETDLSDLSAFSDASAVGAWALEATRWMVHLGVVQGSDGKLNPLGNATCEQALVMFYRAYIYLIHDTDVSPAGTTEKYQNVSAWAEEELEAMDEAGLIPESFLGRDMTTPITRREMCYVAMQAYLSLNPNPIFRVEER